MADTSDISFEVCDLKAEDSNPLTDLEELRRFLKLKCGVVRMFGEGMKNIQSIADGWLVKLETDGIVNFSHAKLERELMSLRDWDRLLSEHALMDTRTFSRIKKAVKRYIDDEKDFIFLRNYKKQYKDARTLFDREVEKVELIKEKYHKKAFEAEKVEIKRQLTEKEDAKKKYGDMLDELTRKTDGKFQQYLEKFDKVIASGQTLKEASNKYGAAKFQVDKKRAAFVIEKLQEYGQNVTLKMDGAEEADFSGIRIDEIVKNQQPMEQITVRKMEIYKGTKNKEALFKQVREEMQTERRNVNESVREAKNSASRVSPLSLVSRDFSRSSYRIRGQQRLRPAVHTHNLNSKQCISAPTSDIELGKKYLIITAYKKLRPNQLSLAQGKTVKLLMPPNDDGYAFGEIKGKFGSKKKGYFPINNVITKK